MKTTERSRGTNLWTTIYSFLLSFTGSASSRVSHSKLHVSFDLARPFSPTVINGKQHIDDADMLCIARVFKNKKAL